MSVQSEVVHINGTPHIRICSGPHGCCDAIMSLVEGQKIIHNVAPCDDMHALTHDGTSLLLLHVPNTIDMNVFIYGAEHEMELSVLEDKSLTTNVYGGYLIHISEDMNDALRIPNITLDVPALEFITYV